MLFVPFAIFLMHSQFVHAEVYDKTYPSMEVCLESIKHAVSKAQEVLPEGGSVKGGCLPLGSGVDSVYKPPKEAKPHQHQDIGQI